MEAGRVWPPGRSLGNTNIHSPLESLIENIFYKWSPRMELDKRYSNKLDKTFIEYSLSISFGLIKPVIELPLKTADRQAHNATQRVAL